MEQLPSKSDYASSDLTNSIAHFGEQIAAGLAALVPPKADDQAAGMAQVGKVLQVLRELKQTLECGAITEEVYEMQKKKYLDML